MIGRVTLGAIALTDEEEAFSTRSTRTGGLGISGTSTRGASCRNGKASGCSSGSTITTAATATCNPTEAATVHRFLEDT